MAVVRIGARPGVIEYELTVGIGFEIARCRRSQTVGSLETSPSGIPAATQSAMSVICSAFNERSLLYSKNPASACHGGMVRSPVTSTSCLACFFTDSKSVNANGAICPARWQVAQC